MTKITTVSAAGLAFNARHEGKVLRAYRCPAGVITIGFGFTMRSKLFAQWWQQKHGRALRMGDTMLEVDALDVLELLMNHEYGKAVADRIGPKVQHQFDASTSVAFNCGTGATGWKWGQALARGDVAEAARLLRTTAITAGGKPLAGLRRRRAEEAELMLTGNYGSVRENPALTTIFDHAADFTALGYDPKEGVSAVKAFQLSQGLTVDGLIGPATRAALKRAVETKTTHQVAAGGGVTGTAVGGGGEIASTSGVDGITAETAAWALGVGVTAFVVIVGVSLVWRYRGPLFAWLPEPVKDFAERRGMTLGRRVPT